MVCFIEGLRSIIVSFTPPPSLSLSLLSRPTSLSSTQQLLYQSTSLSSESMIKFSTTNAERQIERQKHLQRCRGSSMSISVFATVSDEEEDPSSSSSSLSSSTFITDGVKTRKIDFLKDTVIKTLLSSNSNDISVTGSSSIESLSSSSALSTRIVDAMISFVVDNINSTTEVNKLLLRQQRDGTEPAVTTADVPTTDATTTVRMVVFDKDGTLGDCNASLRRWVQHMVTMIRHHRRDQKVNFNTDEKYDENDDHGLIVDFYKKVGWDPIKDQVVPSAPVAAGTWDQICDMVCEFLIEHKKDFGFDYFHDENKYNSEEEEEKKEYDAEITFQHLAKKWTYGLDYLHGGDDPVIHNLKEMMDECHKMGYLVAVCTSDDRAGTDMALEAWGVDGVVDVSICGDEVNGHGKPSAVPIQMLCERATVHINRKLQTCISAIQPQNCIMVGDTTADTGMALASNVGFCVGVLTGSGTTDQLLGSGADMILSDVGQIPILLKTLENIRQMVSNETSTLLGDCR